MPDKPRPDVLRKSTDSLTEFEAAAQYRRGGLIGEFWYLLSNNKKWWLLPILIIMLAFGGLMLLSSTAVAPLIYTLF